MLLIVLGRITQFALLLLTLRLATNFLSPVAMGNISLVISTVGFFALLLFGPVGNFINRRLHAWDLRGQATNYLLYFWLYILVANIFAALVLITLVGFNIWNPSINIYWLLLLVCGNLIFGTLNQTVIPGLNLFGHRDWFLVLTVATTATSLIFAVALVLKVAPNAENWLSGLLIGQLIVGLIGKKIFYSKLKKKSSKNKTLPTLSQTQIRNFLNFSWPIAIAVGLGWIQSQSYRYLMEERLGLMELGLFVAGYGISAGLIAGFESVFTTYFQPKFYKQISNDNVSEQTKAWQDYAQAILPSLLITSFFIMATAPDLTQLLLGSSFSQSSKFIIWGSLAESARISISVFGMAAHARMNTKLLLFPNLVGALFSVTLVWYLIPIYGSEGVGLGLVISFLIALLLTIRITSKYLQASLPFKLFLKSVVMGGALLMIAKVLWHLLDYEHSYIFSIIRLGVIALFFLSFQYVMLLPVLRRDAAFTHH